jgi:hypothetical protein
MPGSFHYRQTEEEIETPFSGLVTDPPSPSLCRSPPPLAQPEQHHDDGAREQEVDGPAQGVPAPQPKHPQNSQY